jgi:flagellar basal-body rod protein FlgB
MLNFSHQVDMLGRLLDMGQMRHSAISQNLANVDTPGYQRLDVTFEESLRRSVTSSAVGKRGDSQPVIRRAAGGVQRADGNNVDVDMEIGDLNQNALLYQTYVQVLATQLAQMRAAIGGT